MNTTTCTKPTPPAQASQVATGQVCLAEDLDVMSIDEIATLQRSNLRKTVQSVAASDACQARWPGLQAVSNVADLTSMRLFSPRDLEALSPPHTEDLVLGRPASGLVIRSSGTSRHRKVLYHSWAFDQRVGRLGARGLARALNRPPSRIGNCLHPGELNGSFGFAQDVARQFGALSFPIGSSLSADEVIEVIEEHQIDTLMSSPSYAISLLTEDAVPRLGALRNLLYIGEAMGESRCRMLKQRLPQIEIRSLSYSTSELGPIGYQCRHLSGSTHHVHEDVLVVEVLDRVHMSPLPEGQVGEIVVSSLTDSGMPLFRYRIGDEGFVRRTRCACGSNALQLTLAGRVSESLNVDGTTISRDLVMVALSELGIRDASDCQFQVWSDETGFRIRLLLSQLGSEDVMLEAVEGHLRRAYHMKRVFTGPAYRGFEALRVDSSQFERTSRGKTPFFVERMQ